MTKTLEVAPWPDYSAGEIREGYLLIHPSGEKGIVVYRPGETYPNDEWFVEYEDGTESRLCLQIGTKGKGVCYLITNPPEVKDIMRPLNVCSP